MYGLLINRLYLEEILDGRKTCDARSFPTGHRGRIALLDNKSLRLMGFATLRGIRECGYGEYRRWQTTIRYQIPEDPLGDRKKYYLYQLEDVSRIEPRKVETHPCDHVWVFIKDSLCRGSTSQDSLLGYFS